MIVCNNIAKKFNDTVIFSKFSYTFENHGLYVLYGASGSGKTTLLQILMGIHSFDDGSITYDSKVYEKKVDFDNIQDEVAYISQDSYFIDYLTMQENLSLLSGKIKDEIASIVHKFKLDDCLSKMPNQISGGERQRFALIGAILQEKRIFFLDEPTSSLDKNNKQIIYEILNELKENNLIICATHDSSIFDYKCEVIDFNDLSKYAKASSLKIENKKCNVKKREKEYFAIFKIFSYLWKQVLRCEKKLIVLYIFIFVVSSLLIFTCTNYDSKLFASLVDNHHLKSVRLLCSLDSGNYCEDIFTKYNVSESVYHYLRNIPVYDDEVTSYTDFQFDILSLPFYKKNLYNVDDMLLYGDYFKSKNEIILGYNKAVDLENETGLSMEKLIGYEISLSLPDGPDNFKIAGIFNKPNDEMETYLKAILGQYDFNNYYFVNNEYQIKYLHDDVLGADEVNSLRATSLTVFFDTKEDFLNFYNDYKDADLADSFIRIQNPVDNFAEYYNSNELLRLICSVSSLIFFALAMIFYYQIHKTRIAYTEHNYSIYEYYGYKGKDVRRATILYFMVYIFVVLSLSLIIASIISKLLNNIIITKNILPFPLFVVDINWILILFITLELIAFLEAVLLNHSRKRKGWFYLIKEKSDLL